MFKFVIASVDKLKNIFRCKSKHADSFMKIVFLISLIYNNVKKNISF